MFNKLRFKHLRLRECKVGQNYDPYSECQSGLNFDLTRSKVARSVSR